jgi:hypothetical protein
MSSLKYIDQTKFEQLLGMGGGYLLNFTDRTFRIFVSQSIDIDPFSDSYGIKELSKANKLREIWTRESDAVVGKLNSDLLDYFNKYVQDKSPLQELTYRECQVINDRLLGLGSVRHISALSEANKKVDLETIVNDIRRNIDNNLPEMSLDRLHTYMMHYMRELCVKHHIDFTGKESLNSLCGKYKKWLWENNKLESKTSSKIMSSVIDIFEEYNDVRNNSSAAHANQLLNKIESHFIVDTICNLVDFLNKLENEILK